MLHLLGIPVSTYKAQHTALFFMRWLGNIPASVTLHGYARYVMLVMLCSLLK